MKLFQQLKTIAVVIIFLIINQLNLLAQKEDLYNSKKYLLEYLSNINTINRFCIKSFLPQGAQPPLDMNKELMEKYRDSMMRRMQVVE